MVVWERIRIYRHLSSIWCKFDPDTAYVSCISLSLDFDYTCKSNDMALFSASALTTFMSHKGLPLAAWDSVNLNNGATGADLRGLPQWNELMEKGISWQLCGWFECDFFCQYVWNKSIQLSKLGLGQVQFLEHWANAPLGCCSLGRCHQLAWQACHYNYGQIVYHQMSGFVIQKCCCCCFNKLRPRQNGRHFTDYTFKCIFLKENIRISIKISLMFVAKGPINNIPVLIQIMAWRLITDKVPSHYLNQWWLDYQHIYASLRLNALRSYISVPDKEYYMVT